MPPRSLGLALAITVSVMLGACERAQPPAPVAASPAVAPAKPTPQQIREAALLVYTALGKVIAMVEVGTRSADHQRAVGEAWFEAKRYLDSAAAKASPDVAADVSTAAEALKNAQSIWDLQIAARNDTFYFAKDGRCLGAVDIMSNIACDQLAETREKGQLDKFVESTGKLTNPAYPNTYWIKYDFDAARRAQWLIASGSMKALKAVMTTGA